MKILILGAGNAQVDLIEYAKACGYETHGCSYMHGDSGEPLLDHFALINITDVEGIKEYIKENDIDVVYSVGSDMAMPGVMTVAKELGMKHFVEPEAAIICNNKHMLREALGHDFEGNVKFQVVESTDAKIELEYPLIMKPVDSQGQRGVFKIESDAEFEEHIEASLGFSRSGKVIVEDYIEGDEISVNAFSVNGKCVFCLVSDRIVWEDFPGGIIHKHLIPSHYANTEVEEKIIDLAKRTLDKLGIKNGPSYFQIKVKNGVEPVIVEVTPRLDGCHMWKLIKHYCGVDLLDLSVKLLLGETEGMEDEIKYPILKESVMTEFLCQPPATSFDRSQFDVSDVLELKWYYEDGDTVKKMNGFMEKGGYKMFEVK